MAPLSIPRGTLPLGLPFPTAFSPVGIRKARVADHTFDLNVIALAGERMPPDRFERPSRTFSCLILSASALALHSKEPRRVNFGSLPVVFRRD
jgi:hypothetical protein